MSILHMVTYNVNVFARNINTPTVSIFSRFYCNVVITIIKVVIFNEIIFAVFWIHFISIRSMLFYGCTLNGYVFREDWMNVPHWSIIYSFSFNYYIFALIKLNEVRL